MRSAVTLICIFLNFGFLQAEDQKLNYLILLADDISSNSIGCYGSKNPHTTPNIDQLATEGVRFTNMFVSEAICAPARAELYTGLTPYRNGVVKNHQATKEGTLSIVQHLSKLGYRVGLTGKGHIKPKSVYPFEKVVGFPSNCNHFGPVKEDWSGVEKFVTQDPNQPFCLVIASTHAHAPWDAGDSSRWELDKLVLPAHLADTPETRHYFREYLAEVRLFDEQVGKAREMLEQHQLADRTVLIVLDENGAGMPGGKWTTYDWGVRSACIMKWPEGSMNGQTVDSLAQYCDVVPTLIEAAGGELPDGMDGRSLLPLLKGETKQHRDNAYFIYNAGAEGTQFCSRAVTDGRFKLIWSLTPDTFYAVRTINGFEYGYTDKMEDRHVRKLYKSWLKEDATSEIKAKVERFKHRPEFQLFDLDSDPEEMVNLAENPEYKEKLTSLRSAIEDWMKQVGDSGAIIEQIKLGNKVKKPKDRKAKRAKQ